MVVTYLETWKQVEAQKAKDAGFAGTVKALHAYRLKQEELAHEHGGEASEGQGEKNGKQGEEIDKTEV